MGLFITIAVCFNHATTDTSATKVESWIQTCKGHEACQPSTVHGRFGIVWSQQRPTFFLNQITNYKICKTRENNKTDFKFFVFIMGMDAKSVMNLMVIAIVFSKTTKFHRLAK